VIAQAALAAAILPLPAHRASAESAAPSALAGPAEPVASAAPERADEDNLTRVFAEHRRRQIDSVDYDVHLTLDEGSDEYRGRATITARLARTDAPLSIDFKAKAIESIRANGAAVADARTFDGFIEIPARHLAPETLIEVRYTSGFSKTGDGFQKIRDPEDGNEYAYTDFEPYQAHTMIPCFDQPDLKARFRLTLDLPSRWKAIGNELVLRSETKGDRTTTTFARTPPISTYLFFAGAGPFAEWNDREGATPLVIYARQSLKKYVDADRLFETTKKGLRFYADYFGTPYPFSKYGQIFIPEFMWGGMENPGAVTLNERNLYRGAVTASRMHDRDGLILHEMAHMWFGDLVTMRWWNDLWLNESFASYVSVLAQARAMNQEDAWIGFHAEKGWAYWQDQLVTTHPIETRVADVRSSRSNFDGITYAKGAATLKQLHFVAGDEGFRAGLRAYFAEFAWKNTRREDFTAAIAKASKIDLERWTHDWLQTAGPNRVRVNWSCEGGAIESASVAQRPSVSGTLSPHRTQVGTFAMDATGRLVPADRIDVRYAAETTKIDGLIGRPCPDFVHPNLDDHDYALFALDETSAKRATQALEGAIEDPLLRLMIGSSLDQMLRDTKLSVSEFLDTRIPALREERNGFVLGVFLGRESSIRNAYELYLTPEQRARYAPALEAATWTRATDERDGADDRLSFFDFYLSIAETDESMRRLAGFLDGAGLPKGIALDQDRRWKTLEALAVHGAAGVEARLKRELERDATTTGQRSAYAIAAAFPTEAAKARFWKDLVDPDRKVPLSTLEEAARLFHAPNRPDLSSAWVDAYFEAVQATRWAVSDHLVDTYLRLLFPMNVCTPALLQRSEAELGAAKTLTPVARRAWMEANDELGRCVAIRAKARGAGGVIAGSR